MDTGRSSWWTWWLEQLRWGGRCARRCRICANRADVRHRYPHSRRHRNAGAASVAGYGRRTPGRTRPNPAISSLKATQPPLAGPLPRRCRWSNTRHRRRHGQAEAHRPLHRPRPWPLQCYRSCRGCGCEYGWKLRVLGVDECARARSHHPDHYHHYHCHFCRCHRLCRQLARREHGRMCRERMISSQTPLVVPTWAWSDATACSPSAPPGRYHRHHGRHYRFPLEEARRRRCARGVGGAWAPPGSRYAAAPPLPTRPSNPARL
mmetsp:Transcript_85114/g.241229  ORF Transcript_85114/g.241229 Transcript_85114/m.241229 type:complete len:263 (+) Transcript_85114:154-942(+)